MVQCISFLHKTKQKTKQTAHDSSFQLLKLCTSGNARIPLSLVLSPALQYIKKLQKINPFVFSEVSPFFLIPEVN